MKKKDFMFEQKGMGSCFEEGDFHFPSVIMHKLVSHSGLVNVMYYNSKMMWCNVR